MTEKHRRCEPGFYRLRLKAPVATAPGLANPLSTVVRFPVVP